MVVLSGEVKDARTEWRVSASATSARVNETIMNCVQG